MNDSVETQPEPTNGTPKPTTAAARLPKARILIAEDSETTRQQLKQLLETSMDAEVETAGDGSEALEKLTEGAYHVVLTDLRMPRVNGMELIEEVQKRRLPVAVIVTTGYGSI